jgi:NTP pyrophosphatase (non-canonical NTP hydrolase)
MFSHQFDEIVEWQKETFNPTTLSCLKHLQEEILEVVFDLKDQDVEKKKAEFADCFILLFGAAALEGMTYADIAQAVYDKMQTNKNRNWKLDKSGKFKHIESNITLEKWLENAKSLNLTIHGLENHINMVKTCDREIYDQLEGKLSEDKAKILFEKWRQ